MTIDYQVQSGMGLPHSGIASKYTRNGSGTRTMPWETPGTTRASSNARFSVTTALVLLENNHSTQPKVFPPRCSPFFVFYCTVEFIQGAYFDYSRIKFNLVVHNVSTMKLIETEHPLNQTSPPPQKKSRTVFQVPASCLLFL